MAVRITIKDGVCQGQIHEVGQVFTADETTPEGMCLGGDCPLFNHPPLWR